MLSKLKIEQQEAIVSLLNIITSLAPNGVGPAIQEGLYNYWGRVKQARINTFLEKLKEYFETISGEGIDTEYLKSEDFAQLFELVLRKVSENRSAAKLIHFRNIIINNIHASSISDFSETFLNIIGQLHEMQIEILHKHFNLDEDYYKNEAHIAECKQKISELRAQLREEEILKQKGKANNTSKYQSEIKTHLKWLEEKSDLQDVAIKDWREFSNAHQEIPKSTYNFYIQDLASKCLLVDRSIPRSGPSIPYEQTAITEFGKEMLNFIKGNK